MKYTILTVATLTLAGCMGDPSATKPNTAKPAPAPATTPAADAQPKHDEHKAADPTAAVDTVKVERDKLSPEDKTLVDAQEWCVISGGRLGAMGAPIKVMVKDQPVFICCDGCKEAALKDADKTIAKAEELKAKKKAEKPAADQGGHRVEATDAEIKAERDKLSPEDRKLVDAQEWCAISTDERLGSMGVPYKVMVKDQPVFLCCKGCEKDAQADPDKTLAKVEELKKKKAAQPAGGHEDAHGGHHHEATDADIQAARAKLSAEDRAMADAQEWCPVMTEDRLGCSGEPIKMTLMGQTVFLCCASCKKEAEANPEKVLAKVEELKKKKAAGGK